MDEAKEKAKSIFDSLNDIKGSTLEERIGTKKKSDDEVKLKTEELEEELEEDSVDETGYKYVNNKGNYDKEEDKRDDKMNQKKREILKKVRKDSRGKNRVTVNVEDGEEEEEEVVNKDDMDRKEPTQDTVDNWGEFAESVDMSDEELKKLETVLKALNVPEEIMEFFKEEELGKVFKYLQEEFNIRYDNKLNESRGSKEDNQSNKKKKSKVKIEDGKKFDIKEDKKLAVMEDGFATSDKSKWDKSLVVYESGDVDLEYLKNVKSNLTEFRMVVEGEGVEKKVYIDKNEVNKVLV